MATKGMVIQLNREQRLFLLQALKNGCINLDTMDACGLTRRSRFDGMTDDELADEIVRLEVVTRTCDDPMTERVCKGCYKAGGCWLSWMARDDRELHDRIRGIMEQKI